VADVSSREPAIALRGATKRFGGIVAVDSVDLEIRPGERVGLIGPNGAGKTTLVKLMSGEERVSSGRVELLGRDVTRTPVHVRARRGLGRSFQITELCFDLSVRDNFRLAAHRGTDEAWRETAERFGLLPLADTVVRNIGYGEQRRLEMAMALVQQPLVLLFDEPAAGLDADDRTAVREAIGALSRDLAVLVIDHDVDLIVSISDRIVCMANGRVIADGTPDEVIADEQVQRSYLGTAGDPDDEGRAA
jgi:ABC-type branched-subunit amino acid transport system ATPase component